VWAPRGIPADVTSRLNAAIRAALADPATKKRLADIGQQLPSLEQQTSQALAAYQGEEIAKWWPIIKAAQIRGE
jgi:tripartite-type tricarboxylate transporter receptor subunit TctC